MSGVSEVVRQLSIRTARRGHEVHVATVATPSTPLDQLDSLCEGVHVHRFRMAGNLSRGITGDASGYLNFLASRSWDVIAMHCVQTATTDLLLPRIADFAAARILVAHGLSLNDSTYDAYYRDLPHFLSHVDRIVSLSPLTEVGAYCKTHNLPAPEIIPNGVDLSEWASSPTNIRVKCGAAKNPWLICVSNHYPIKSHHVFFEVVRAIRKEKPNVRATIIGRHYPAWRWNLGRIGIKGGCWYRCAAQAAMTRSVRLETNLSRADVISAIKEADLLLSTSSWEAASLSLLESMAAGTPWLAFDVGSARENTGGIVVASPRKMAHTALDLLDDAGKRTVLARAGQQRISSRHDWEIIATQYEDLYREALNRKSVFASV
jgi:glycosyltransferase involved in cell wall biosynthesis